MSLLVVDLDESLVKTDLLFESVIHFCKENPLNIFKLIAWFLSGGKIGLKNRIASATKFDPSRLPYRQSVIDLIKEHREKGDKIVLASASPQSWVKDVAHYLGIFDEAFGSQDYNLKGHKKYSFIAKQMNCEKFIYIGDSSVDLAIWRLCGSAITVNASKRIQNELQNHSLFIKNISDLSSRTKFSLFVKQIRIHQWAKNSLLLLPVLAAHKLDFTNAIECIYAVLSFSLASSAVYALNDLVDLSSDRNHHSKKNRPLPSGDLRIQWVVILCLVLVLGSLLIGMQINFLFIATILAYWLMNFLYSFFLKRELLLDIVLLSGMYTVRIFAGAAATGVTVSHWLLSFSTLFFFGLACVKRFTELIRSQHKQSLHGRGYIPTDATTIQILGVSSGLLSILIFLLYLQSPEVTALYPFSQRLWLLTPFLLYWQGRLWLLAGRDEVHDDPVIFALKDRKSWVCFVGILVVLLASSAPI